MEEIPEIEINPASIEVIKNYFSEITKYVDINEFNLKIQSFFKEHIVYDDIVKNSDWVKVELITDFIRKYIFLFLRPDLLEKNREDYKKHYLS